MWLFKSNLLCLVKHLLVFTLSSYMSVLTYLQTAVPASSTLPQDPLLSPQQCYVCAENLQSSQHLFPAGQKNTIKPVSHMHMYSGIQQYQISRKCECTIQLKTQYLVHFPINNVQAHVCTEISSHTVLAKACWHFRDGPAKIFAQATTEAKSKAIPTWLKALGENRVWWGVILGGVGVMGYLATKMLE